MAKVYLLCNAHLDPVWLWRREEGIAEAISTFRVAADFCEEYDGFIFNHNESVLYEWVEKYEPELFERIKKLVAEGKWRIMGGWYLQSDCNMPSGESILRQIEVGNHYFMEKFGVKPTTAISVDSFGHNRGLVQILKKSGYENYLFMRPYHIVPEHDFIWKGYDGSEIVGHNTWGPYNTLKGKAVERLEGMVDIALNHNRTPLMLWGIGNHGGGPSRVDLEGIEKYQKEHPEVQIIHSGCEEFFAQINREELPVKDMTMGACNVGCYTTMAQIKQLHRQLENELTICEKMLATSGVSYDEEELLKAEKALLFSEFHDILPGTMIKKAEEDAIKQMHYGMEIVADYRNKAFFKLCSGQPKGIAGEIPVMVYNPNPYPIKQIVELEFQLEDQNWTDNEVTLARVRDKDGQYLSTQNEKEACTFSLDWRKRIAFYGELAPMQITRFDCELYHYPEKRRPIAECAENDTHFLFDNGKMQASVNKKTGLLDSYVVNGKEYLLPESAKIKVYADNGDPWAMQVDGFYDCIGAFSALSTNEVNVFNGYPEAQHHNTRVIENGDVRLSIQVVMKHENSYAVVTYTFPKQETYVDVNIKMLSNDVNRMYKLAFETPFANGTFAGQGMFGREILVKEEKENVYQKWCCMYENEKTGLAILNAGTYGGSAVNGTLQISLLRTPIYSNHPVDGRPLSDDDRNHEHIDMGEREFAYRLTSDMEALDTQAEIYNQPSYALSFFPSGMGEKPSSNVQLDNKEVLLTSLKPVKNGMIQARVYNGSDKVQNVNLRAEEKEIAVELRPYEFQTLTWADERRS